MKGLSLFNKFAFATNIVFALLLLIACAAPYLSVEDFPFLPILGLGVPVLVVMNSLFFLFWAIQRKRQLWVSLFILIFGYFTLGTFVKLRFGENQFLENDLKVMSYNVRAFDQYRNLNTQNIPEKIKSFIQQKQPDIVCLQEAGYYTKPDDFGYPYHFFKKIRTGDKLHVAIFSKYPILKAELIDFPDSINNGSYADIAYKGDTIRVYNVHMQSLGIPARLGILRPQTSKKRYKRATERFKRQQEQAKMIEAHKSKSPYKNILCGDFNNTQFSNVYRILKGNMQDTFIEKGFGYDRTFNFIKVPLRIDFILADDAFEVIAHENFGVVYSDHFPVMASFRMK